MIDYHSFPKSALTRLVPSAFQTPECHWNNIAFGVPKQLLSRYWRPARGKTPEWTLPADDPAWSELLTYVEAQLLYADMYRSAPSQNAAALAEQAEQDRRRVAREQYRAAVKALPGGMDPLWKYSTDGEDNPDDLRFMIGEHSIGGWTKTWFPRLTLKMRYGTASLTEYAARNGIVMPAP